MTDMKMIADISVFSDGTIIIPGVEIDYIMLEGRKAFKINRRLVTDETSYLQSMWRETDVDEDGNITYFVDAFIYGVLNEWTLYDTHFEYLDGNPNNCRLDNLKRIPREE